MDSWAAIIRDCVPGAACGAVKSPDGRNQLTFLRPTATLVAAFFAGLAVGLRLAFVLGVAAGLAGGAFGTSPKIDLAGQILKTGHFWQPTAMAMGQIVMART